MSRDVEIANLKTVLSLDTGNFKKELTSTTRETSNLKKSFDIAAKSIDNAEDKIEATTKALDKGEKALTSMNKKLELQKRRYDDLKSTIEKQSVAYDKLNKDLNKAENELAQLNQASDKNVDAIKKQEKAIEELKKALSNKADLIDKNISKLQKYSNDIDKTENDITSLSNQMGKLKNAMNEVGNNTANDSLEKFKDLANEAGVDLGLLEMGAKGAAVALAAVITKKIIDAAGTYDKAITDLQITMGLTEDAAKDMYNAIQDISDGGYSIEGISTAVKMLQQRFELTDEEVRDLAQGMDLLNKYGYEHKDVIRFMTSAVKDWGMTHEEALDYIIKGEQEGLNISEDWLDTLVEYTPILSTLGVDGKTSFALISEAVKATGLDTDKAADMVKEFFLTLTDGSSTSKDAFADLGIDIDNLKNQINEGSITSVDAMKQVMQAISGVGDETEQARLLQEIFKGTIEYGSIGVVEAWANMEESVVNTEGAIDSAKEAYEGSYEAMKQDLTQSWDELVQIIGSAVIPTLKDIVEALLTIPFHMEVAGAQMSMSWDWCMAHLSNAWIGFKAGFLEGVISIAQAVADVADTLGFDGIAKKMNESVDSMKTTHKGFVDEIRTNEETINNNSRILGDLWNEEWNGTLQDKKSTFNTIMGEIVSDSNAKGTAVKDNINKNMKDVNKTSKQEMDQTSKNVSTNLDKVSKDASTKTTQAKTSAQNNFKGMKDSANTEMKGVNTAVDSNMNNSLKTVQVQATGMYKGVKTSFHKMSQAAREDGTEMYKGVQTSANKMASSAKSAATDMYKGVTSSTSKMAQKAISDWNRVRNAYANPIRANINVTKTQTNVSKTIKGPTNGYSLDDSLSDRFNSIQAKVPDISKYTVSGGYYSGGEIIRSSNSSSSNDTDRLLSKLITILSNQKPVTLHIENFNNNNDKDIEDLANELAFYLKRKRVF